MTVIADLWRGAGGDPAALDHLDLSGADPVQPSSFRVGAAAQATIGAVGLAAAELWHARTGRRQTVAVDMRHAAAEFRSEGYLRIEGAQRPRENSTLPGLHPAGDGRLVRLHVTFPHHRQRLLALIGARPERDDVRRALARWTAFDLETAAFACGGVVTALRTAEEWAAHPHGRAVAGLPVLVIERIGDAPPRPLPAGPRPLSGIRVLDLTRVIAGPVAGRALAAHGAEVLHVGAPGLPTNDWLEIDTGRGKRSTFIDLSGAPGRADLQRLLADADILLQGYRPGAIAGRGFDPEAAAQARPGIVYVSLSAWGHLGPWAERRGFDSLVQTATGYNHAEGLAAGGTAPRELPCQALDHASGYLLALGAMMARLRQSCEGGSWLVRVALAGTGRWLWELGRVADGFAIANPGLADITDLLEERATPLGPMRAVRHAARLSETPAAWTLPPVPLGTHPAAWA